MTLKKLTIYFQDINDLFKEVHKALDSRGVSVDSPEAIYFDSLKTYRAFMTSNKSHILSAVSKLKPSSVYELAQYLERRPQHVLADCRSLESHGFINLIQEKTGRRQLRPELSFEYDVILIDDKSAMPLAISEESERVLAAAV